MTLDVLNLKKIYPGNGVNEEWTIDFPFFKAEHVRALHVSEVGIETELVQGTDFTVTGGDGGTGSLTFPIAGSAYPTLPATEKIAIFRDTPLLQELALRNFDEFNVRLIMRAMDLLTMQNQEQADALDRAVKVAISDDTDPDELIATLLQGVQDAANAATDALKKAKDFSPHMRG